LSDTTATFGYTVFWVHDADAAAAFYETVFGLARRLQAQTPLTPWIELETGPTALAFAEFTEADVLFDHQYRRHDPDQDPVASVISFVTDDVEGAYARALESGARSLTEPRTEPWGQTIARVVDPAGLAVSIATPRR
jgi:uncharacterized glyoxalase superfamily protein PhnB